ncbi:butyrophilin subfamily 1 member A1-like isoform X4 [Lepisosteus oculatus]|uniref:butyrophilin subfamily 1 member A1-like isoform X4 n=1 Tax=Lepisosteus oculatus TaxID=7918 RepID=UPI00073FDD22|nr:PREDICTED: butyrophilin subfamily 1 member A1-like isoform X2 [Lepisosteus oculatus]
MVSVESKHLLVILLLLVRIPVTGSALGSQPSVSLHSPGGGQTQLLCRSEGWFPAPAVIWTDRDGHDVTSLSSTTVEKDSQGLLSVSSYIPVQQESNIFSCLVRSALPEPDWESQLHIPKLERRWISELNFALRREIDTVKRTPVPKSEWQWLCSAAGELTLDPDTAHGGLVLSRDGLGVRLDRWMVSQSSLSKEGRRVSLGKQMDHFANPRRFDSQPCVLARQGFTSGRHYWEVEGNEDWRIGVSRESAQRTRGFKFTPQEGYWGLGCYSSCLIALTDPVTPLHCSLQPRRVGVCVDIEERQVSFYSVETRTHIYTFTDMVFKQGEKICPFFWTIDKQNELVLLPPVSGGD